MDFKSFRYSHNFKWQVYVGKIWGIYVETSFNKRSRCSMVSCSRLPVSKVRAQKQKFWPQVISDLYRLWLIICYFTKYHWLSIHKWIVGFRIVFVKILKIKLTFLKVLKSQWKLRLILITILITKFSRCKTSFLQGGHG